ncbi:MAG: YidC/Oxa1 family membrane protein insertase [Oscillospiraceae bacterium]|nr:YidC/Oxa1 family membrane protein insertase [Oscillospiraceae bacterium]
MGFISQIFAYPLEWIYSFINNYAIALLIFAILVKILLFPLGIKQQKNTIKQAKLRPKEMAIRNKYKGRDDQATKQKVNNEIMQLYQDEKFSPLSGCLPLIIQFPILIALYDVIRKPLTYLMQLSGDTITALGKVYTDLIVASGGTAPKVIDEMRLITDIKAHTTQYGAAMTSGGFTLSDIPNLSFLGYNLGDIPSLSNLNLLLLIPVLALISAFISQFLMKKYSYQPPQNEADSSLKVMQYGMPFISLVIAFQVPALVGLYWIYQNLLSPVQQYILAKMYPIPKLTDDEIKAAERAYGKQEKIAKVAKQAVDSKNRKSLVYDDDDDTIPSGGELKSAYEDDEKEQANMTSGIISPAPLKDSNKAKNKSNDKK